MKLEWDFNSGGSMGPNMLLRLDGHCVGHFYEDAHGAIDADQVREDIASRYNAHDALVAALEHMVAERHEPSGEAVQQAYAALALARGEG